MLIKVGCLNLDVLVPAHVSSVVVYSILLMYLHVSSIVYLLYTTHVFTLCEKLMSIDKKHWTFLQEIDVDPMLAILLIDLEQIGRVF